MSLWQSFYGSVLERRRDRARPRAERLPRPVISLGNLHWGGGGKTPMTQAVARHLRNQGQRVVILSRGHKRKSKGPLVVSRGEGALVPVSASGDEPALLARLDGVGVVVAEKRYLGGCLALKELDCDIFLLDDGFSHVQLARDLDVLLFPAADPLGGSRLFPSGRLREPLSASKHAHAVVLTGVPDSRGADNAKTNLVTALDQAQQSTGWNRPAFVSRSTTTLTPAQPIRRALLVTAEARPASVHRSVRELASQIGFELAETLDLPDHHAYPQRTLETINARAATVDSVLVTGKDWVKLQGRLRLPESVQMVELDHQAEPQVEFFDWLDRELSMLQAPNHSA